MYKKVEYLLNSHISPTPYPKLMILVLLLDQLGTRDTADDALVEELKA